MSDERVPEARSRTRGLPVLARGKELVDGAPCDNSVCQLDDPEFSDLHAILLRAEDVWTALSRYKYDEDRSWAEVLGRIVTGYLDERAADMRRYDLITTGALYVGPRANRLGPPVTDPRGGAGARTPVALCVRPDRQVRAHRAVPRTQRRDAPQDR